MSALGVYVRHDSRFGFTTDIGSPRLLAQCTLCSKLIHLEDCIFFQSKHEVIELANLTSGYNKSIPFRIHVRYFIFLQSASSNTCKRNKMKRLYLLGCITYFLQGKVYD